MRRCARPAGQFGSGLGTGHTTPCCLFSPDQSLPEEEQQRVLGEEKMLNINKKQTTSPASKKPSQEGGKVGRERTPELVGVGKAGSLSTLH